MSAPRDGEFPRASQAPSSWPASWALRSSAELFVTNVLNGGVAGTSAVVDQGTVLRIGLTSPRPGFGIPAVTSEEVVGSGFGEQASSSALIVGPTGVGLGDNGILYVADTLGNRVAAIPDALHRTTSAGIGNTISQGGALNSPLGLTIAPMGTCSRSTAGTATSST